jgi:hypothetical protein
MLELVDAIHLPSGVRLDGSSLVDDARDARFPANDTALFVLRRTGQPLGSIAAELARRHDLDPERARDDVLRFALSLNALQLVNVVRGGSLMRWLTAWLRLVARLAPAGVLPPAIARRTDLDTSSPLRAAFGAVRALSRRAACLATAAALVAAPGQLTPGALALALGVGLGLVVHEAGHAALLAGVSAALVVTGLRTYVLHRPLPPGRRSLVALAGPCAAAALGIALIGVAWLVGVPELALAGCAPAAHAIGLTAATADGRAACGL